MKPIGMDKNRVLIYDGDIVIYKGKKWKSHYSELLDGLLLVPYIDGLDTSTTSTIFWNYCAPGAVEVLNISDRTNYERYFADLCSRDEILGYLCIGVHCRDCILDYYLCTDNFALYQWLDMPAVKL